MIQWAKIPTAIAADLLGPAQVMEGISAISSSQFCGVARTVRVELPDFGAVPVAVSRIQAGEVLVIEVQGGVGRAVLGGILGRALSRAGAAGVIVEGAVRDVRELIALNLPVLARARCPLGPLSATGGVLEQGATVGGVSVCDGDLILSDEDGVVVVPKTAITPEFLARAQDKAARDDLRAARIEAGDRVSDVYGFDANLFVK